MEQRADPLNTIAKGIKDAGLDHACLYLTAFNFVNEWCFGGKGRERCKLCPPKPDGECPGKLPECVHQYLKGKLGVDIPAIQPRAKPNE